MTFWLNFHGIGAAGRAYESGEEPYWIAADRFAAILDLVEESAQPVGITFDDGNASDYHIAAKELRARGRKAMFFVLAGKLDQPGYLTANQLRELDDDPLFAIGSHGMMHRAWPECAEAELQREIGEAQAILSAICGRPITRAALPFGRYNRRVLRRLSASGHKEIYSSDGAARLTGGCPIPRFSVRSDMSMAQLKPVITAPAPFFTRAQNELRARVKSII